MNSNARQALEPGDAAAAAFKDSNRESVRSVTTEVSPPYDIPPSGRKIRVRVASENLVWHEGLRRMLGNHACLEILGGNMNEISHFEEVLENLPDVLLLTSCENLDRDISNIRKVRVAAPEVRIVMFGGAAAERDFFNTCALEFAFFYCFEPPLKMYAKRWKQYMRGKHPVRARFAVYCSIILSAKRLVCLPELYGSNWA